LYWKNEHDVSVSDNSKGGNTASQEHPKAAPLGKSQRESFN